MTQLNKLTASDAARKIAKREISSEALVRDCLERIAQRDREVQAWQFVDPEAALAQARVLDRELQQGSARGPLHGVPLGVKDIFDTFDMPSEYGSPIYKGNRPVSDAGTVARARHAGMVILGKTVTCELATHVPSRTRNPHNLEHTPGGSSAGSAAAVADCMTQLAIGTQTVGSTIRPASFCGVVGYKPTFNLLSRAGCKTEGDSLDTVGVMARSVPDVALYAGTQTNDARLISLPALDPALRIGICRTFDSDLMQAETAEALERAARELARAGARVGEFTLPEAFRPLREAHRTVANVEMSRSYSDELYRNPDQLYPTLRERIEEGAQVTGEEYAKAQAIGHRCRAMLGEAMGECDVLLAPSAPGEAPKGLASTGSPALNQIWTFLWTPTVTVPVHKGPNGLPVGLQVCGRMGDDPRTLAAAHWIHQRLAL
ncbi:MAG: amidase [Betaproteobacteria bacterium]|nr:amidase [Betaproteobacteria bacterium]